MSGNSSSAVDCLAFSTAVLIFSLISSIEPLATLSKKAKSGPLASNFGLASDSTLGAIISRLPAFASETAVETCSALLKLLKALIQQQ